MERRQFLRVAGLGTAGALAGCGGDGGTDGPTATTSGSGTPRNASGQRGGPEQSVDHPAATDLEEQPRRGSFGGHLVLTFEDPSCPRCRAFHRETLPEIQKNLVATGKAAYVYRNFPVVYEWGDTAAKALEVVHDRKPTAHWPLLEAYFGDQGAYSTSNVLDRTAEALADVDGVDGQAVVEAVESGSGDAGVQADVAAAEAADLPEATPTVLLFRNGTYATTARGSVSYDLVAETLGE